MLVGAGHIGEPILTKALQIQNVELPRRSIGQILVRLGATTPEAIRDVMTDEIERVVSAILSWKTGRFEFVMDDLTPLLEVTRFTGAPKVDLDTQAVLMDALRRMDEANAGMAAPLEVGAGGEPDALGILEVASGELEIPPNEPINPNLRRTAPSMPAVTDETVDAELAHFDRPRFQLVSTDTALLDKLNPLFAETGDHISLTTLRDAGASLLGEVPPIVVVDLRNQINTLSTLAALCRSRPRASVVALFEGRAPLREMYQCGVLSVTSQVPETIVACTRSVGRQRKYMANEHAIAEGIRTSFARLRRIIADLRSGLLGTSVSSNLLSALAESLDRGILFVPHRDRLVALGAFGSTAAGISLAESTRGLILPTAESGILADCVSDMHTRRIGYDDARLAAQFRAVVDRPKNGEMAILPVPGSDKLIALIYLDNGARDRTIGDIEIFELASFQLGLALENELLRRELRAKGILPAANKPSKQG
jgi:hypothetical protein